MRKPQSGEPNAREPHVRFGGRGGREPFSTPIVIKIRRNADKTKVLPHLRGKLLIIWIPAFAGMTNFESNGKSGLKQQQ